MVKFFSSFLFSLSLFLYFNSATRTRPPRSMLRVIELPAARKRASSQGDTLKRKLAPGGGRAPISMLVILAPPLSWQEILGLSSSFRAPNQMAGELAGLPAVRLLSCACALACTHPSAAHW